MMSSMNVTRWIFAAGLFLGFFWLSGILLEPVIQRDPPAAFLFSLSLFITLLSCFFLFKLIPDFLKRSPGSDASILKYYLLGAALSYFLLIPVFALFSYLLTLFFGDIHNHEATILIISLSLWLPLWWFVPAGLSLGWLLYRKRTSA
jgi:hypothetical protein